MEKPTVVDAADLLMKADNMNANPIQHLKLRQADKWLLYLKRAGLIKHKVNNDLQDLQEISYHIELEKKEHKVHNQKTVVQEKIKLKHHPKENYEK